MQLFLCFYTTHYQQFINKETLVFNKGKGTNSNVLFIDASKQYESAKNQNKLRESDIEHIVNTYRDFAAGKLQPGMVEDKFGYVATAEEIQENAYNLYIPRYVDTFEEEPEVDIAAVQKEIEKLEGELDKEATSAKIALGHYRPNRC